VEIFNKPQLAWHVAASEWASEDTPVGHVRSPLGGTDQRPNPKPRISIHEPESQDLIP